MLDSVLVARDRWLNPGGAMYPSHATMYLCPVYDHTLVRREQDHSAALEGWRSFASRTNDKYGVDMSSLTPAYTNECKQYFGQTALWVDCHPDEMLGPPVEIKHFDILTVSLADFTAAMSGNITMAVTGGGAEGAEVNGILGWFTTDFRGSPSSPAVAPVVLSTAPSAAGATHWGQQQFNVSPPIAAQDGDLLKVDWHLERQTANQRLFNLQLKIVHESDGAAAPAMTQRYRID